MVPQTTSQALLEMTTVCLNKFRVLFATGLWLCSPRSAGTHAMFQPAAVATRHFCILLGSGAIFFMWSWQIYSRLVSSFLRSPCTKNYWNRFIFDRVISKIKRKLFFWGGGQWMPDSFSTSRVCAYIFIFLHHLVVANMHKLRRLNFKFFADRNQHSAAAAASAARCVNEDDDNDRRRRQSASSLSSSSNLAVITASLMTYTIDAVICIDR